MHQHILVFLWLIVTSAVAAGQTTAPAIKAFPSAEGFGATARGGRGGRVLYVTIDANLNNTPSEGLGWLSGDMNLDGSVTGDDYTVIDANLGLGSGNPLSASALSGSMPAGSLSAVPEPASLATVGLALGAVMARRRRQVK